MLCDMNGGDPAAYTDFDIILLRRSPFAPANVATIVPPVCCLHCVSPMMCADWRAWAVMVRWCPNCGFRPRTRPTDADVDPAGKQHCAALGICLNAKTGCGAGINTNAEFAAFRVRDFLAGFHHFGCARCYRSSPPPFFCLSLLAQSACFSLAS